MTSNHSSFLLLLFVVYCYLQLKKKTMFHRKTCRNYAQILTALYRLFKWFFFSILPALFLKCTEWLHITFFLMKRESSKHTQERQQTPFPISSFPSIFGKPSSSHLLSPLATIHAPAAVFTLWLGFRGCRAQFSALHTCFHHTDSQTDQQVIRLWRGQAGRALSLAGSSSGFRD